MTARRRSRETGRLNIQRTVDTVGPYRYKNDPQITAMTDLVGAYQRREVHEAEKIIRGALFMSLSRVRHLSSATDNRSTIMDDAFIRSYIGELLRSLRTQYLIDLINPYTRLELSFLANVRSIVPVRKPMANA